MHLIKRSVPKYDSVWYLTAPYDIRLIRHLSQVGSKENSDRVQDRFPGSSIFDQMEIELKDLLRVHGKIRGEFDTSKISCDEVADYIMIDLKDIFR